MLDVYGELFMMMAGVDMVRVPYRGAPPAVTDLAGGRVDVVFDTFAASIALVRAGQSRALAVTTATRSEALPDIPSLGDFLPGYDASSWRGITDNGMFRVLRHNQGRRRHHHQQCRRPVATIAGPSRPKIIRGKTWREISPAVTSVLLACDPCDAL